MATENNINGKIKVLSGKENNKNIYTILHPETTSEQVTDFNEASQNLIDTSLDNFLTTKIKGSYLPINANASSATKLATAQNINISDADGTNTGTAISFNGSAAGTIKLPSTIKASLTGNADTATKLANSRSINVSDADGTNTGTAISFNGTSAGTIKLPSTIKASLTGNATSATNDSSGKKISEHTIEYIEGTQTAATASWTGISKDPALYAGKVIVYKLPFASAANATLNLTLSGGNTTGAIAIYRYNTTKMSTEYAANYYVPLVYNGTSWFAFADYDTNQIDRTRAANTIAVASGAIAATRLIGTVDGHAYSQINADSVFDINYPILYNASAISNNANLSTSIYWILSSVNLRTIVNDTTRTWDVQKPLYLKGTLSDNNFTVHEDILTTTIPTTEDGFTYIFIGYTYSTYQANINLLQQQKFTYKNGAFTEFIPNYLTITDAINTYAPKVSPALSGTPTAPTAATSTNNTQIATTAFAHAAAKAENTDAKVAQNKSTTNATYPVLIAATADANANITATSTQFGAGVKINPSTSTLSATNINATTFNGALNGNASSAAKATSDGSGNNIASTYSTKENTIKSLSISGKTITYTKDDDTTGTIVTQDTTYAAATSSTLGLVKTGSNITNSSGTISLTKTNVTNALGYTPPTSDTNTHYTTKLIAGAVDSTANTASTNGNTYLRLFDDSTARNSINIKGSGATTVTSDANGVITISSTDNNTTYSAATTSANGLMSSGDKSKLDGIESGATAVSIARSLTSGTKIGTITINGTGTDLYCQTNTDTHYTTKLIVGSSTDTANVATSNGNTYLRLFDNTTARNSINIKGSGATTVTSDANGVITISSTDNNTTYSAATTSANGLMSSGDKSKLDGIQSGATAVSFTQTKTSGTEVGKITINGAATTLYCDTNTDTHWTTKLIAGGSTATANAAVTSGNVYLRLFDNSTHRNNIQLKPGSNMSITSDTSGIITFNSAYSAATTSANGLMSSGDKSKLDGIQSEATAVSFTQTKTSGTEVGKITINGTTTTLYCDTNTDTNTDTKVTNTLNTTAKAYITGTTGSTTNTGTQIFDTGVYLSTTAGELVATKFTGALNGNAATATSATSATTATTASKISTSVTGANAVDVIYVTAADNDYARIRVGGTAANAGYMEIATADDSNEPIYVRQYSGAFSTVARTATLLDASGNTIFPGTVTATSFNGNTNAVSFTSSLTSGTKIGTITINGTGTDLYCQTNTDTDTHYTTKLIVGGSTATANAATSNGATYLRLFDNTTARNSINIKGSGATTVTSDANGVITISSTDTNTNTDTNVTQTNSTASTAYPILLKNGTGTGTITSGTLFASGITVTPSTGTITATKFVGSVTGNVSGSSGSCTGNAATATKATQDSAGNTITSYYAPRSDQGSVSLALASWTQNTSEGTKYKWYYNISISGVTANDTVTITIPRASQAVADAAEICPTNESAANAVKIFAKRKPSAAFTVYYTIHKGS